MKSLIYYIHSWGMINMIVKEGNNEGKLPYCFYYLMAIICVSFTDWFTDVVYGGDTF